MTEDRIRELFWEMRDEPVPADSLARVRANVAAGTRARRRRVWFWAGGSLAPVCALVIALLFRTPASLRHAVEKPPGIVAEVHAKTSIDPAVIRSTPRRVRRRKRAAAQLVSIRMETADPDVVILLIGN